MINKLLEYQEIDKKLRKIKREANGESGNLQDLNASIKDAQNKILELEETSKDLLSSLNKLMEVEKKGIAYVSKYERANFDSMTDAELADFEAKAIQTSKQLAELETRISAHNAEVKRVVLDYKMYRKRILDAKEKREQLKTQAPQAQQEPDIEGLKHKMAELEKQIEPNKMAKYKALKQDGVFPVLVPLAEKRCGGCRVELSSTALDKLKNGGVYECEQCHRLIFADND